MGCHSADNLFKYINIEIFKENVFSIFVFLGDSIRNWSEFIHSVVAGNAITYTSTDQDVLCLMVSPGHIELKHFFFACLFLRWIKTTWTISKWSDNIKSKYVPVISKPLIKQMLGYCKKKIGIYFNKSLIKIQTFSVKTVYGDLDLAQHRLR